MRHFGIALAALLAGSTPSLAEYPDRPIQIVVPYTPSGTVDLLARALGPRLTAAWGQPVVILNRPGAGGSVGADAVAKSAPDGYTLLISTNSPLTTNLALYPSLGYEPLRDFEPVILAGEPPSPINPPSGCRFRTRCPFAEPVCVATIPALGGGNDLHLVACHMRMPGSGHSLSPTAAVH